MALSQVYTAIAGDTITAARWNNEFGNIYDNGTDVGFPLTKAVSAAGFLFTLDAGSLSSIQSTTTAGLLFVPGSKSGIPGTNGSHYNQAAATFTDNDTAVSGTAALWTSNTIRRPTLAATNASVTTTRAATFYIENAPLAGTNQTLTNPYAILVDDGKVQLDGALQVEGTTTLNGSILLGTTSVLPIDSGDPYQLKNLTLSISLSVNILTLTLQTAAGTTPTSTDPVRVRFRNATLGTGGTTNVNVTAATTLVISAGSTLGTVSAQAHRIYIGLLNNAGTAELFVYNPLSGTSLRGLSESGLITTTAEGGAGGADSAQVSYSTTARTSVAFRIIGFFESTQSTAGNWATSPSTIQELQPWMPRTGHVVGSAITTTGANTTGVTTIPTDDTLPQNTEGTQVLSLTYTPVHSGLNYIRFNAIVSGVSVTAGETATLALFTSASSSAVSSAQSQPTLVPVLITHVITNSAMTSCSSRIVTIGTTWSYNAVGATAYQAASQNTILELSEIMV